MKTKNVTEKNMKVCLVGSSGGHLTHLYMLKPFWKDKNRFWVTFDKEDARSLLEGEKVYPCYFPTNRSIKALIKNTKIAWDVLHGSSNRQDKILPEAAYSRFHPEREPDETHHAGISNSRWHSRNWHFYLRCVLELPRSKAAERRVCYDGDFKQPEIQ